MMQNILNFPLQRPILWAGLQGLSACAVTSFALSEIEKRAEELAHLIKQPALGQGCLETAIAKRIREENQLQGLIAQENEHLLSVSVMIIQRVAFVAMQYVPSWPVAIALHVGIIIGGQLLSGIRENTIPEWTASPSILNRACVTIAPYITPVQLSVMLLLVAVLAIYQDLAYLTGIVCFGMIRYIIPKHKNATSKANDATSGKSAESMRIFLIDDYLLKTVCNGITVLVNPILFLKYNALITSILACLEVWGFATLAVEQKRDKQAAESS